MQMDGQIVGVFQTLLQSLHSSIILSQCRVPNLRYLSIVFFIFGVLAHCFLYFTLIIVDYEILLYRGEIQPRKARKTGCVKISSSYVRQFQLKFTNHGLIITGILLFPPFQADICTPEQEMHLLGPLRPDEPVTMNTSGGKYR